MKKWQNVWPFLAAIVFAFLNVDWVVAPLLRSFLGSTWLLFIILTILANAELLGWYCFWRWFFMSFLPSRKKVKETVEFAKEIGSELKDQGYVDKIINYFEETFEWATNPKRWLSRAIKAWGHLGMFFLGFEPFVAGGRLVGVVFCATTGWKNGLYSLCLGNIIHIFIVVGSWEIIFYAWGSLGQIFFQ